MNPVLRIASTAALALAGIGLGYGAVTATRMYMDRPPALEAKAFPEVVAEAKSPLVLFATTTCPWCREARRLLTALDAPYVVLEIDRSPRARELLLRLGGRNVPVLVRSDEAVTGFDEAVYRRMVDDVRGGG